jgi:hypothetical protein
LWEFSLNIHFLIPLPSFFSISLDLLEDESALLVPLQLDCWLLLIPISLYTGFSNVMKFTQKFLVILNDQIPEPSFSSILVAFYIVDLPFD